MTQALVGQCSFLLQEVSLAAPGEPQELGRGSLSSCGTNSPPPCKCSQGKRLLRVADTYMTAGRAHLLLVSM